MSDDRTINVLLVEPLKPPRMVEMPDTLEGMEELVGGPIEEIMPFDEEVAIVWNEEARIRGFAKNRALYAENGEVLDIISGTFFVCAAPFDCFGFDNLRAEQQRKYSDLFRYPDRFIPTETGLKVESGRPQPTVD